jgi:hypothetical protein
MDERALQDAYAAYATMAVVWRGETGRVWYANRRYLASVAAYGLALTD